MRSIATGLAVFSLAFVLLFLGMCREPNIYDEGLVLTAAIRVAAGQIPHRDFYANYGPAQFYILAALFKAFGVSLLVERLYDLLIKALVVVSLFLIANTYASLRIAGWVAAGGVLWLFSVNSVAATPVIPVGLLNLIAIALLLPAFRDKLSGWRSFGAGAIAGLSILFRYDTGIALFVIEVMVLARAAYSWRLPGAWQRFLSATWPCLPGLILLVLPPVIAYLAVAPFHAFLFDIFLYPAKYYHAGRNLPWPPIQFRHLENCEFYLLPALFSVSICLSAGRTGKRHLVPADESEIQWRGFLFAFGLLTLAMYCKGVVRMQLQQMYLAILPSLLLLAVLLRNRRAFSTGWQLMVKALVSFSIVSLIWATLAEMRRLQVFHFSVAEYVMREVAGTVPPFQRAWCETQLPLTRGFCFLATDDRVKAIDLIVRRTVPDQKLFSGLDRHDKIFADDNLIYFATGRLPATMWSHFDPGLQNSLEIQTQMIRELEQNVPPVVVLESEFGHTHEPNDSDRSSGIFVLDDYLHSHYRAMVRFGEIAIWQRAK